MTSRIDIQGAGTPYSTEVSEEFAQQLKRSLRETSLQGRESKTESAWGNFLSHSAPSTASFRGSPNLGPIHSQSTPSSPVLSSSFSLLQPTHSMIKDEELKITAEKLKNGFVFVLPDELARERFIKVTNQAIQGFGQAMKDVRSYSDSQFRAIIVSNGNGEAITEQLNQTFGSSLDWK